MGRQTTLVSQSQDPTSLTLTGIEIREKQRHGSMTQGLLLCFGVKFRSNAAASLDPYCIDSLFIVQDSSCHVSLTDPHYNCTVSCLILRSNFRFREPIFCVRFPVKERRK